MKRKTREARLWKKKPKQNKKQPEGSRKSDWKDILHIRDWPGLEKVKSEKNNKRDVQF